MDGARRPPPKGFSPRAPPLSALKPIPLTDPTPGQPLPPPRQLVAAPRELLLRHEQLEPRCEPLFTCPGHVLRHRSSLLRSGVLGVPGLPLELPRQCLRRRSHGCPLLIVRHATLLVRS